MLSFWEAMIEGPRRKTFWEMHCDKAAVLDILRDM